MHRPTHTHTSTHTHTHPHTHTHSNSHTHNHLRRIYQAYFCSLSVLAEVKGSLKSKSYPYSSWNLKKLTTEGQCAVHTVCNCIKPGRILTQYHSYIARVKEDRTVVLATKICCSIHSILFRSIPDFTTTLLTNTTAKYFPGGRTRSRAPSFV